MVNFDIQAGSLKQLYLLVALFSYGPGELHVVGHVVVRLHELVVEYVLFVVAGALVDSDIK